MKIPKKGYLPIAVFVILFLLFFLVSLNVPEETIRQIAQGAGLFGPLVLIFLLWLTYIIAPLGGAPFLFAGFFLYGNMVIVYASVAAFIASITNFWIARTWGRTIVLKMAGVENVEKIDKLTRDYGLQTLFIFRIFLRDFHDVISYAFGLTKLPFKKYLLVSTAGMVPGAIIWFYFSSLFDNAIGFTVVTILITYGTLVIFVLWKKYATS